MTEVVERFRGNCVHHVAWCYPDKVFCELNFTLKGNAVHDTLNCCERWERMDMVCNCVREARKSREDKP